jgi:hypothetical protein
VRTHSDYAYFKNASRHCFFFAQSTPLLCEQEVNVSRCVAPALAHLSRHAACSATVEQSKKLIESHWLWQLAIDVWLPPLLLLLPPLLPVSLPPCV